MPVRRHTFLPILHMCLSPTQTLIDSTTLVCARYSGVGVQQPVTLTVDGERAQETILLSYRPQPRITSIAGCDQPSNTGLHITGCLSDVPVSFTLQGSNFGDPGASAVLTIDGAPCPSVARTPTTVVCAGLGGSGAGHVVVLTVNGESAPENVTLTFAVPCKVVQGLTCAGHGSCRKSRCECDAGADAGYWAGDSCDQCAAGHWGLNCMTPCPGGAGSPCNGHGTCEQGRLGSGACVCAPGYVGSACGIACPTSADGVCSGHGSCSDGGTCDCASSAAGRWTGLVCEACVPGMYGPQCTRPCPGYPDDVCSGRGLCSDGLRGTGQCACDEGYTGPQCEVECYAGGVCSRHGRCAADGACACDRSPSAGFWDGRDCSVCLAGYSGADCDLPCPANAGAICSGAGTCSVGRCQCVPGRCGDACETDSGCGSQCEFGYWGADCSTACPGYGAFGVCTGHGSCDWGPQGTGTCACDQGYLGPACGRECPRSGDFHCNAPLGGQCDDASGQCVCYSGWAGPSCSVACQGGAKTPCNGRGVCSEGAGGDGSCTCDATSWGADCQPCPGVAELLGVCYGHGACARDTGACACSNDDAEGHWGGEDGGDCSQCVGQWFGPDCKFHCPVTGPHEACSGHGSCRTQSNVCQCQRSAMTGYWTGTLCDECEDGYWGGGCTRQCPGGACNPCNQHGTCADGRVGDGQCRCHDSALLGHWQGLDCAQCQPGFWGLGCTSECPGGHALPCTGHGVCDDGPLGSGRCACDARWTEANCTQCAQGYFGPGCGGACPGLGAVAGVCSGHGRCSSGLRGDGRCLCAAGHWGPDCGGQCPRGVVGEICDARGTCSDGDRGTGQCVCPDDDSDGHWAGPACSICQPYHYGPRCLGRCAGYDASRPPEWQPGICAGHGTCRDGRGQSGACACESGYAGVSCELTCPGQASGKVCSLRGKCDPLTGVCKCANSSAEGFWAGADCDVCQPEYSGQNCQTACPASAAGVCSGHGECLQGRCFCRDPYCGSTCEASDAAVCLSFVCLGYWGAACANACPGSSEGAVCSGHGQCDDGALGTGICACDATWSTPTCSQQCPGVVAATDGGLLSCSGQGTCDVDTGACTCLPGSAGPGCAIGCPRDPLWGICASHGTCRDEAAGDGVCVCDAGYMGPGCAEECPGGRASPCSGHGTCVAAQGACVCVQSGALGYWAGDTCATCRPDRWGPDCLDQCLNGASVDKVCHCVAGWVGPGCDVPCPGGAAAVCHGHGTCVEARPGTAACACAPGWLEAFACARTCNGGASTPCGLHGACDNATGTCMCFDTDAQGHFSGDACERCAPEFFPPGLCTLQCPKDSQGRNCSGHGGCGPGESLCRCDSGPGTGYWTGDLCDACDTHYWGPQCQGECPGGVCNPCNGHGTCSWGLAGTGACTCQRSAREGLWQGPDCSACVAGYWGHRCAQECPGGAGNPCYGHGVCSDGTQGSGACACDAGPAEGYWDAVTQCADCRPGYWGQGCTRQCPSLAGMAVCSGHGSCSDGRTGTGECTCTAPYYDADCGMKCPEDDFDPTTGVCSLADIADCENGVVVGDVCDCFTGWRGLLCTNACPGLVASTEECAGHGQCGATADCACDAGWAGYDPGTRRLACNTRCPGTIAIGASPVVCSGHGHCHESATCECVGNAPQGHWSGSACERCAPEWLGPSCTLQCPKDALGRNCSGHGQCLGASPECTCHSGPQTGYWAGPRCSDCAEGNWGPNCSRPCPGDGCVCAGKGHCFDGTAGNGTCRCEYNVSTGFFVGADCTRCQRGFWGINCRNLCPGLSTAAFLRYDRHDPLRPDAGMANPEVDGLICFGHGTCRYGRSSSGQCDCYRSAADGFWDGVCDDCLWGYWGLNCTSICQPPDRPGDPCHGGGVCHGGRDGDGSCECDAAHAGVACEMECPSFESRLCNAVGRCSNGTAGTGRCECPRNVRHGYWTGDACQTCVPGRWGPNCTAECLGGADRPCNGHGDCFDGPSGNGQCACGVGWAGTACEIQCPGGADNVCSGHGVCDPLSGACMCNAPDPVTGAVPPGRWGSGAAGDDCSVCHPLYSTSPSCGNTTCLCATLCPINPEFPEVACSGHGECKGGVCARCSAFPDRREYWCGDLCEQQGIQCSLTLCPALGIWGPECTEVCPATSVDGAGNRYVCSGHGSCDDGRIGTGACDCDWGYTGAGCDRLCPGGTENPCAGHGWCTALHGCVCNRGWAGAVCDVPCRGGVSNPCTGRGQCRSGAGGEIPGSCACDAGWSGFACEEECPGGALAPCTGHGKCGMVDALVVCTCDRRNATGFWSGAQCDACHPPFHGHNCSLVCANGSVVGRRCNCSFAYFGSSCHETCPGFDGASSVCNGHGVCDWGTQASGACTCDANYYGADCSTFCSVSLCQATQAMAKPECDPAGQVRVCGLVHMPVRVRACVSSTASCCSIKKGVAVSLSLSLLVSECELMHKSRYSVGCGCAGAVGCG